MKIGNVNIDGWAALAPMAGETDRAFRELCVDFGASYVVGEMVSAKGLVYNSEKSRELLILSDKERPAAVQLFGNEPAFMAESAKIAMEYLFPIPSPFEIIDYSFIKISFNVAYSMDRELKLFEKQKSFMIEKKELYNLELSIILCFVFILIRLHHKNLYYNIFVD